MRYHESFLGDFSGILQVDSHSNAFLNLTLMDVMGSIHGTISSSNFTQVCIFFQYLVFPVFFLPNHLLNRDDLVAHL